MVVVVGLLESWLELELELVLLMMVGGGGEGEAMRSGIGKMTKGLRA